MNPQEEKYNNFSLCREMLETAEVVKNFNADAMNTWAEKLSTQTRFLLTGEGSSRLFPAKHAIYRSLQNGDATQLFTEGATQAMEYELVSHVLFGVSNSGKTKEVVRLFQKLKNEGHQNLYSITAHGGTPLPELAHEAHVLNCGNEDAVAATKSVVEQALTYDTLFRKINQRDEINTADLSQKIEQVLTTPIESEISSRIAKADTIYFAGRNNGVAEELTLKTNEITRKKSDYLEGTYSVHGIEEVMQANDVIILISPFADEEEKMAECLQKGIGLDIFSISSEKSIFPTLSIPDGGEAQNYLELACGWNLLVETGLQLNVNLDKPQRARKVGNDISG